MPATVFKRRRRHEKEVCCGYELGSSSLHLSICGVRNAAGLVEGVWISLGLALGAYANWYIVAPRLRGI